MCNQDSEFTDLTYIFVGTSQTSGCAFVYFTVQNCMEYNSAVVLFQVYDV